MFKVAFALFSNINQPACLLNHLSVFDCVLYMHHWEFPIQQKITPILTYPIYKGIYREHVGVNFQNISDHLFTYQEGLLNSELTLPPRYQPIRTIYIPFESFDS